MLFQAPGERSSLDPQTRLEHLPQDAVQSKPTTMPGSRLEDDVPGGALSIFLGSLRLWFGLSNEGRQGHCNCRS